MKTNPYIVKKILKWISGNHKDGLASITAHDVGLDQSILVEQLKCMAQDKLLSQTPKQEWVYERKYVYPDNTSFLVSLTYEGQRIMLLKDKEDSANSTPM